MKLRKVLAALAAAAVATSAMAISASATFDPEGHIICILSNDSNVPVLEDKSLITDIYGFKATVSVDNFRDYESALNEGTTWFGGGIGMNANSTTWIQLAKWGVAGGEEDVIWEPGAKRGVYTITYTQDKPCFAATEEYAFFWLQDWSGDKSFTYKVEEVILLDKDGNNVLEKGSAATTPEPATPEEPTPADPTEEPVEEPTEEESVEEPTEEESYEEFTEEPADEFTEEIFVEMTEEPADEPTDEGDASAAAAAPAAATATDKGSPETGVAGVAAAAGVAALAGVAVVVARKRK